MSYMDYEKANEILIKFNKELGGIGIAEKPYGDDINKALFITENNSWQIHWLDAINERDHGITREQWEEGRVHYGLDKKWVSSDHDLMAMAEEYNIDINDYKNADRYSEMYGEVDRESLLNNIWLAMRKENLEVI